MILHDWFEKNRREFPWREERTPYRVWISEVMLQQTRAVVVIPYFLRWMEKFPTVRDLAAADIGEVIKAWEGLGYYSRARNLHKGAREIVERFDGEIPATEEELSEIAGIGPYTRGAILSFGFQKRAVAIDGNVQRVMSRLLCLEERIDRGGSKQKVKEGVEALLDGEVPWVTAEALIELGATVCLPRPKCDACPLQEQCLAFRAGKERDLPIKGGTQAITFLKRSVAVLLFEDLVLVKKGERGKVMEDLYEFPYVEGEWGRKILGFSVEREGLLKRQSHTFTRFKALLIPEKFRVRVQKEVAGFEWVKVSLLKELPFSSGHRKIVQEMIP